MITKLRIVGVIVHDQDEALRFYRDVLGFEVRTDQEFGPGMRWLTVAPREQTEVEITLLTPAPAMMGEERSKEYARQVGKSPPWSYSTDDCRRTYEELSARGVKFTTPPTQRFYGVEAVFEDLYGNPISMVEPSRELREAT